MSYCVKEQQKKQTVDHVVTEVKINSEVRLLVGLDVSRKQSPLVSLTEATQQSETDGIQSQQERILIDGEPLVKKVQVIMT